LIGAVTAKGREVLRAATGTITSRPVLRREPGVHHAHDMGLPAAAVAGDVVVVHRVELGGIAGDARGALVENHPVIALGPGPIRVGGVAIVDDEDLEASVGLVVPDEPADVAE